MPSGKSDGPDPYSDWYNSGHFVVFRALDLIWSEKWNTTAFEVNCPISCILIKWSASDISYLQNALSLMSMFAS